ncbi:hypothetical protein MGYG_02653 [Nannizzia gypsea CBS 118893]|uniref:Cyanovirin-N domain-containing protein n=1 Tax=Arthroderma gypseum (strain ATCC MYA-4604 / CBS 118893) TaxID=535722 RepID=E4UNN8_ARTGP|nr:hypothetical protein MGYG_02653 [Nannizzia gypsea CBS 118893]EFQ99641.1 hypothetical protein MGYG_02653 [Nannizzia gypsea CBS 118893]
MKFGLALLPSLAWLANVPSLVLARNINTFQPPDWLTRPNFGASCGGGALSSDATLWVTCSGPKGHNQAVLDLNHCLANDNGKLVFRKDGNFSGSCKRCEITPDDQFRCSCTTSTGDSKDTDWLDLNEGIANYNGRPNCFGFEAFCPDC